MRLRLPAATVYSACRRSIVPRADPCASEIPLGADHGGGDSLMTGRMNWEDLRERQMSETQRGVRARPARVRARLSGWDRKFVGGRSGPGRGRSRVGQAAFGVLIVSWVAVWWAWVRSS